MAINNTMESVQLSSYTAPRIIEIQEKEYVSYGEDNNYFKEIISYYNGSTTNGSIINGVSSLIYGRGLQAKNSNRNAGQWAKFKNILKAGELKKVILDRKMLGMAAMQITYNNGVPSKITHFPMHTLRAAKASDNGKVESWGYNADWSENTKDEEVKRIPSFGFGNNKGNEIFILQPYVTGSFYYTQPDYAFSLPYAKLESEIGDYLINDTVNGFSGSMLVNFNNGIPKTVKEQRQLKNKVVQQLTGATGQKLMVNFNKNGEQATTIERFALDNAPDHYQYLADECRNKLIVGHRITSPLLIGVREAGSGFGSNADEIETSFKLMNNVLIKIYQDEIIDALDAILSESGIALDLFFLSAQPLDFYEPKVDSVEEVEKETEMLSKQVDLEDLIKLAEKESNSKDGIISNALIEAGEDSLEGYSLLDERDVLLEDEDELDSQINELNEVKLSNWDKLVKLAKTGTARPTIKSKQDKEIDGVSYKVRYKYVGDISDNSRQFCKDMIKANKIYRKEDIIAMKDIVVNPKMGVAGSDLVNVWEFKGSVNCKHKWQRLTFASDKNIDVRSPKAPKISTNKAEKKGYRVRNDKNVSIRPIDMKDGGKHPNNKS